MKRWMILALTALTACGSQPPANVVYKGGEFYGRNSSGHMSRNWRSDMPEQIDAGTPPVTTVAAPTGGIASSDLAPPTANPPPVPLTAIAPPPPSSFDHATKPLPPEAPGIGAVPLAPLPVTPPPASSTTPSAPASGANALPAQIESSRAGKPSFIWPVDGPVISMFGKKQGGLINDGINVAATEGEAVQAAADGAVIYAGNELTGYGNLVMVKHTDGYVTSYAHLSRIVVDKGQSVKQGDILGNVGKSGNVKSPQLHFGVRAGGNTTIDPLSVLPTT